MKDWPSVRSSARAFFSFFFGLCFFRLVSNIFTYIFLYSDGSVIQNSTFQISKDPWSDGPKSFTSLIADLCQNINSISSIIRCLNGTFPWRKWSVKLKLRREDLYLLLFSFGLMYQCLNRAIPLRKCSIKALLNE